MDAALLAQQTAHDTAIRNLTGLMQGEVNSMKAEIKKLKDEAENREKLLKEQQEKEKQDKDTKDKEKTKNPNLRDKKSFQKIPSFGGKPEDYDDWNFKWMTFLSDEPQIVQVLKTIDEEKSEPSDEKIFEILNKVKSEFEQDQEYSKQIYGNDVVNQELYQALCLNLEEKSDAIIVMKNMSDKVKTGGILGWWKLGKDVNSMTAQRLQSLAGKVYGPKRVKTYGEVAAAMEEWETHLKQFERTEKEISDQTKLWSIRQIVPDELESDIIKNTGLDTYKSVKSYIAEQCSIRRDKPKNHRNTGPVEMNEMASKVLALITAEEVPEEAEHHCGEEDGCQGEETPVMQLMSFMKGFMGKGGKG